MFDDLIRGTKIIDGDHMKKLLDRWEMYDPRIVKVLDNFTEKIDGLEKNIDTQNELLIEASDTIKELQKLLEDNKIEYETKYL
jgi:hypothetical protein